MTGYDWWITGQGERRFSDYGLRQIDLPAHTYNPSADAPWNMFNSTYGKVTPVQRQQEFRLKVRGCDWQPWQTLGPDHTFRSDGKYEFRPKDRGAGYYRQNRPRGPVAWFETDPGNYYTPVTVEPR